MDREEQLNSKSSDEKIETQENYYNSRYKIDVDGQMKYDKDNINDSANYADYQSHVSERGYESKGEYEEYLKEEYGSIYHARQWMSKILFATMIVFFAVTVMVPWYRVFQLPSLDLLTKSHELKKNPDVQLWMESVVIISSLSTKATGFNISESGTIITNYHVVEKNDNYFVTFANGQIFKGRIVAEYPDLDIAIIDIDGYDLPSLELSSALDYEEGELLTIIGNPMGLSQVAGDGEVIGFIKIDDFAVPALAIRSPILKGNSGSPVLNKSGKVIGVIFANMGADGYSSSDDIVGLATPIDFLLTKEYFIKSN